MSGKADRVTYPSRGVRMIIPIEHNDLEGIGPDDHHVRQHDHSDPEDGVVSHNSLADVSETDSNPHGSVRWKFPYDFGETYSKNDMVKDGDWTMIANKETTDRAAPQMAGSEFGLYSGGDTPPTTQDTAKQIIFGNRYVFTRDGYLKGYRIYVTAGNIYRVFAVIDPTGSPIVREQILFEATTSAWIDFALGNLVVKQGTDLDLVAVVYEPAASPVTWTGNWNYTTPNNENAPGVGVMSQANRLPSSLRINKTDNDSGDRSTELLALTIGDTISGAGQSWVIQSISDNGNWIDFGVSPATQGAPDGVQEFTFETVAATAIDYMEDVDYWLTSPFTQVQGLLSIDDSYENAVFSDNAYGVDITVQEAAISADWDIVAVS